MFKKLKEKITEEVKQSPLKFQASVQQLAQAVAPSVTSSTPEPAPNDHFVISEDDSVPEPEKFKNKSEAKDDDGMATLSLSRRSSLSSVTNDLFPIYESPSVFNQFQSDLESNASEVEDLFTSHQLDHVSKEKLYTACRKIQARYHKYKGRYTDLVRHYKKLEQENQKAKSILSETQDKALRRIAELKEQCQLEQKAKAHLEEALRNDIEEKDHLINSLNTKIGYLRDGSESGIETESLSKANGSSDSLSTSPPDVPVVPPPVSSSGDASLKEKLKKLEELLQKSKGVITEKINTIKDLNKENTELKSKINELATAKDEVISLRKLVGTLQKSEEEAALSMAESKRSIFLELESKEAQIRNLKETLASTHQEKARLSEKVANFEAKVQSNEDVAEKVAQVQKEMESKWKAKLSTTENHFTCLINEKDRLLGTLKEENLAIEKEMQTKIAEIKTLKKAEKELSERLSKEIFKKETEISLLKESLSKAQNEINLLKCTPKQNESDDHKLQSERLEVTGEPSILMQDEATTETTSPEENKSLNELRNMIQLLNKELNEKENKLRHINEHSVNNSTKLNLSIEKVNQMENDFRSKREEWVEMKNQYQHQIDEHITEARKLKESIGDLNVKLKEKETNLIQCNSMISSLNESLTNIKEDLHSKCQENGELKSEVSELNNKFSKFISESGKMGQIEKDLASVTSKFQEKIAENLKLSQDVDAKSAEIKNLLVKNLNLQSEVDLLNKEVKEKTCSLVESEKRIVETESNFDSEKSSLQMLNEELVSKLKNVENLAISKEEEICYQKNLVANLENSISALKQQLESNNNEIKVELLKSEVVELKKKNEESLAKLEKYVTSLTEVSGKLQDAELNLQRAEQIKSGLEDTIKEKNKECMQYINDHNEFTKIRNILENSNLSVGASVSELISELLELNQSASNDTVALKEFKSKLDVIKKNEEKWRHASIKSLNALKQAKKEILCLKKELGLALNTTKSDCLKLFNDCLNYSIKFFEDKERNFDRTIENFKHREIEFKSVQSELNKKVKLIEEDIASKNAMIEVQGKKISELTSSVQNLQVTIDDSSERMKDSETKIIHSNKIIADLKSDLSSKEDNINDLEEKLYSQLKTKESELAELKSKLEELEQLSRIASTKLILGSEELERNLHSKENRRVGKSDVNLLEEATEDFKMMTNGLVNSQRKSLLTVEKPREVGSDKSDDFPLAEIEFLERKHQQEILEIEKRYSSLLAEKYKEYEILEAKYHEQEQEQERRLNKEVREIMKDVRESEELQSDQLEEFRLQLKQTEEEANLKLKQLKQEHLVEMNTTIKKWKNFLDKKIAELEQRHCDEVVALTKEWSHERKTSSEIISSSNAVVENQELEALANSVGNNEETVQSLNIQLKVLQKELNDEKNLHRLEVKELQKLLSKRSALRQSKERLEQDIEDCTEMEYLRNILYEYMMGKEPVVLARVLAAIVKFDAEQTNKVLQKEEQRISLLGQLGMS